MRELSAPVPEGPAGTLERLKLVADDTRWRLL